MAAGSQRRRWPWGDEEWQPGYANLRDAGHGSLTPVNAHPAGATPEGLLDVAGNVWEWTAHATMGGSAVLRGGSYASPPLYARCTFVNAAPAELRSAGIGLRVVREP
jgi:iron(II)-dependent oxidoreductase